MGPDNTKNELKYHFFNFTQFLRVRYSSQDLPSEIVLR